MINIQIERDGRVSGDVNMVAAYERDRYSQPIRILHPDFPHVIHKIRYRQGRIEANDIISGDDMFRFMVNGAGLVRFQYVAEDSRTGIPVLTSSPFTLNVAKSKMKPSGEDLSHRLHGPDMIKDHIDLITQRLKDVGIINNGKSAAVYDCNNLIDEQEYIVGPLSKNTPDGEGKSTSKYLMRVKTVEGIAIQTAQLIESGRKAIFYRTGTLQNDKPVIWTEWDPLFYENTATVVEGDSTTEITFNPGQYIVIHNEDNTYSLYYDLVNGESIADRVLISTTPTEDGRGIVNIAEDSYVNGVYSVISEDIDKPYDGMMCVFLPKTESVEGVKHYIRFNSVTAPVYVRTSSGSLKALDTAAFQADVPSIVIFNNRKWITNAAVVVDNTEEVAKLVDAFDFEHGVLKDSAIPASVERVANKVTSISETARYTDSEYPTVTAVRDYINSKLSDSGETVTSRVLAGNAPSSVRDFVHVLLTYVTHSSKFVLGDSYTALDINCTNQLNMATLIELALRGIDYYHSKYVQTTNEKAYRYATKVVTSDSGKYDMQGLIDYAVGYGRAFVPTSWEDLLPGDIIAASDETDIHPMKVFLSKVDSRLMVIDYTSENVLKCRYLPASTLPSHVLRFPLNFVNELYSFNLCATEVNQTLSGQQSIELSLDKSLQAEEPYTVHIDHVMLTAGDVLTLRYDVKEGTNSSELTVCSYIAVADYTGSVDFPLCIGIKDVDTLTLVNTSSHIISCQGVGIYGGLIQPPEDYTAPLSATQTAGSSILVYT